MVQSLEIHSLESLVNYRARNYDPSTGRFLTEDPHPGKLGIPVTVTNKYVYGGNNPVLNVDPNGRFFFAAILIGAAIGGLYAHSQGENVLKGMIVGAAIGGALYAGFAVGATASGSASTIASGYLGTGFWGTLGSAVASYGAGVLAGAAAGAVVGAGINGTGEMLTGGSFGDGAIRGAQMGYVAGAIGGAAGAFAAEGGLHVGLGEGSGLGKFLTTEAGLGAAVTTGAYIPLGVYKIEVSMK